MPRCVVIIPARYASSRFPGKPLVPIAGRPMIQHVYARARQARLVDSVIVATDDQRIVEAVHAGGGQAEDGHSDGLARARGPLSGAGQTPREIHAENQRQPGDADDGATASTGAAEQRRRPPLQLADQPQGGDGQGDDRGDEDEVTSAGAGCLRHGGSIDPPSSDQARRRVRRRTTRTAIQTSSAITASAELATSSGVRGARAAFKADGPRVART